MAAKDTKRLQCNVYHNNVFIFSLIAVIGVKLG